MVNRCSVFDMDRLKDVYREFGWPSENYRKEGVYGEGKGGVGGDLLLGCCYSCYRELRGGHSSLLDPNI